MIVTAVAHSSGRFGELDILINNAAILVPRVPDEEHTEEEWDRVMAFNAEHSCGTGTAILAMRNAGGGSIVNFFVSGIGQADPTTGRESMARRSAFSLKSWQRNTRRQNSLHSVHPGPEDSAMFRAAFPALEALD